MGYVRALFSPSLLPFTRLFSSPFLLGSCAPIPREADSSNHLHNGSQSHNLSLFVSYSLHKISQAIEDPKSSFQSDQTKFSTQKYLPRISPSPRKERASLSQAGMVYLTKILSPVLIQNPASMTRHSSSFLNSLHRNTLLLHLLSHELHVI